MADDRRDRSTQTGIELLLLELVWGCRIPSHSPTCWQVPNLQVDVRGDNSTGSRGPASPERHRQTCRSADEQPTCSLPTHSVSASQLRPLLRPVQVMLNPELDGPQRSRKVSKSSRPPEFSSPRAERARRYRWPFVSCAIVAPYGEDGSDISPTIDLRDAEWPGDLGRLTRPLLRSSCPTTCPANGRAQEGQHTRPSRYLTWRSHYGEGQMATIGSHGDSARPPCRQ